MENSSCQEEISFHKNRKWGWWRIKTNTRTNVSRVVSLHLRLSYIAVTTLTSFPIWSNGNCLLAGAQVHSMLLKTSSSKGDSCSVEEYTRPRGTLWRKQKMWDAPIRNVYPSIELRDRRLRFMASLPFCGRQQYHSNTTAGCIRSLDNELQSTLQIRW